MAPQQQDENEMLRNATHKAWLQEDDPELPDGGVPRRDGVTLEPASGPARFLVVDGVERPDKN